MNNDEWTLSDAGFSSAGGTNAATFATNTAAFLTGGSGSILIYSNNFGLTGLSLQTALTGAGYTVTEDPTGLTPFTLPGLSAFQAIFLAGTPLSEDNTVLTQYVNAGGSVYIAAGTGSFASAAAEAAQWNPFLNNFGLTLASVFNGVNGNIAVSSADPVLAGVATLFYNNGNDVSVFGGSPSARVIALGPNGDGLIGVSSTVPEPSSVLLVGLGAAAIAFSKRRRAV